MAQMSLQLFEEHGSCRPMPHQDSSLNPEPPQPGLGFGVEDSGLGYIVYYIEEYYRGSPPKWV